MVLKMRRNRYVKVWVVTATYTAMAVTLRYCAKSKKNNGSVAATITAITPAIMSSPLLPLWQLQPIRLAFQIFKPYSTKA